MSSNVSKIVRIRAHEVRLVAILGFLLFCNSLALEIADVVSVSGFLENVGVREFLIVYIIDMVLILLTTSLQSLIVDRFKRVQLIRWICLLLIAFYIGMRLLFYIGAPDWLNYSLLFFLSEQQWLFFPILFWILANDIFDLPTAKRLFPLIASLGFAGQIAGLLIAALVPALLSQNNISSLELLLFNAAIYVFLFFLVAFGLRNIKVRETRQETASFRQTLKEGWDFVAEVSMYRYLMISIVVLAAAITILEFHFFVVAEAAFINADGFQTLYSLFRMAATFSAFVLQGFITGRILEKLSLKNSFFFLPGLLVVAILAVVFLPGLIGAALGFGLARITRETIDESARKSALALVPEERRGRVSLFMDSYMVAFGIIIGCIIAGLVEIIGAQTGLPNYFYIYLAIAAIATVVSLWAIFMLRKVYDSSLLNWRLKRRQRTSKVLEKLDFS